MAVVRFVPVVRFVAIAINMMRNLSFFSSFCFISSLARTSC